MLNKKFIYLLIPIILFGIGFYFGNMSANVDELELVIDSQKAEIESLKSSSDKVASLEKELKKLRDSKNETIIKYKTIVAKNPLPANCNISNSRLQHIQNTIKTANSEIIIDRM